MTASVALSEICPPSALPPQPPPPTPEPLRCEFCDRPLPPAATDPSGCCTPECQELARNFQRLGALVTGFPTGDLLRHAGQIASGSGGGILRTPAAAGGIHVLRVGKVLVEGTRQQQDPCRGGQTSTHRSTILSSARVLLAGGDLRAGHEFHVPGQLPALEALRLPGKFSHRRQEILDRTAEVFAERNGCAAGWKATLTATEEGPLSQDELRDLKPPPGDGAAAEELPKVLTRVAGTLTCPSSAQAAAALQGAQEPALPTAVQGPTILGGQP